MVSIRTRLRFALGLAFDPCPFIESEYKIVLEKRKNTQTLQLKDIDKASINHQIVNLYLYNSSIILPFRSVRFNCENNT